MEDAKGSGGCCWFATGVARFETQPHNSTALV